MSIASVVVTNADVWRADALARGAGAMVVSTGSSLLDAQLPGGGWPVGAIVEILQVQNSPNGSPQSRLKGGLHGSHCEWRLLLPTLIHLTLASSGALVLVGAPHAPFCPGLAGQGLDTRRLLCINTATPASRLWASEQALRCADVAAVLVWLPHVGPGQVRPEQLRRLQMAANTHAKLLFVMRPESAREEPSPAALRLLVSSSSGASNRADFANHDALVLHILKRRGPPLAQPLLLPARPARLAALLAIQSGLARQPQQADQVGKMGEVVQLGQRGQLNQLSQLNPLGQVAQFDPQETLHAAAAQATPAAIYTLPRAGHALDRIAAAA